MSGPHDKIIAKAAKAALTPLVLRRKGQSRLWLGDHGWWLAVVEFQPSGVDKGSYLNVAAHWLWSDQGYISFDLGSGGAQGSRVAGFEAYQSDEQFEAAATRLAEVAAQEIRKLAARVPSIKETVELLLGLEASASTHGGSWSTYNAGVAAGLAGRAGDANTLLRAVTDPRVRVAAERYADLTSDPMRFRAVAMAQIANQRAALRLPATTAEPI